MLRRRSGVRRRGLNRQMVQRGRWGGVVRQARRHFPPAGAAVVVVGAPLDDPLGAAHLLEEGAAVGAAAPVGQLRARDVGVEAAEGRVHHGQVLERQRLRPRARASPGSRSARRRLPTRRRPVPPGPRARRAWRLLPRDAQRPPPRPAARGVCKVRAGGGVRPSCRAARCARSRGRGRGSRGSAPA